MPNWPSCGKANFCATILLHFATINIGFQLKICLVSTLFKIQELTKHTLTGSAS